MDANPTDSARPVTADPRDVAPPGRSLLAAIARPAVVHVGGRLLPTGPRLALDAWVQRVRRTLRQLLQRAVKLELIDADPAAEAAPAAATTASDSHGPAFGVALSMAGAEVMIWIDEPLARLLVDGLTANMVQLRGSGPLTDAELGVLDFAVLATLDTVMRDDEPPAALTGTLGRDETRRWIEQHNAAGLAAVWFAVEIAGRQGRATLWLSDAGLAAMLAMPAGAIEGQTPAPTDETVTLRLGLGPLSLSPREWQRAAPGDVILLNAVAFEGLPGCRLISDTGWTVAPARIEHDSASVVSVRCGPPRPRVEPAMIASADADIVLQPMLGEVRLPLEELAQWSIGRQLDLAKDTRMPLSLYLGMTRVAGGEPVRIDGEIGMRLTHVNRPSGESVAADE